MNATMKMRFSLPVLAVLLGGMIACTPVVDNRGNLPHAEDLAQIVAGKTTRDDVQQLLGSPSATLNYGHESWQYISQRVETVAFFTPELKERQVIAINFDAQGVVSSVVAKGMRDGQDIVIVDRETPTAGKELTILEQLMGNVGRFSKSEGNDSATP